MLTITEGLADRFWAKVQKRDDCWPWGGAKNRRGYGVIGLGSRGEGTALAHRVSFALHAGDPAGRCVMHLCDNPECVRPDHLMLGSYSDNNRDMANKGRARNQNTGVTTCRRGHLLSGNNLYVRPDGSRVCRCCKIQMQRLRRRSA